MQTKLFDQTYNIVSDIPKGKVATYGQIAALLNTKDARKVGWALHANKNPKVPCHRVVSRAGSLAKNFAFNGADEQKRRLIKEGITFKSKYVVNLEKHLWKS